MLHSSKDFLIDSRRLHIRGWGGIERLRTVSSALREIRSRTTAFHDWEQYLRTKPAQGLCGYDSLRNRRTSRPFSSDRVRCTCIIVSMKTPADRRMTSCLSVEACAPYGDTVPTVVAQKLISTDHTQSPSVLAHVTRLASVHRCSEYLGVASIISFPNGSIRNMWSYRRSSR